MDLHVFSALQHKVVIGMLCVCASLAPEQFGQISFSIQELPAIGLSSEYERYSFKK
jgi:hypothetical protein